MGAATEGLIAKLEAAGLSDEEKIVLVLAVSGDAGDEVTGFGANRLQDLEAQDKLGNFEIQDLMSRFNQAETLASTIIGGPLIGTLKDK